MSFGVGLAAGIGAGIAMGISSGKKRAATELRDYIENHGITILDRNSKPIKLDQFIGDAVRQPLSCTATNSGAIAWFVVGGVLILGLVAAVGLYLISAN